MNQDLFGMEEPAKKDDFLSILPVSVIDIEPQKERGKEDHNKQSSRANFSPFPKEVTTLACEFFLKDCRLIFDPFAGWGDRAAACKAHGLSYIGYDTSIAAIDKAKFKHGIENTQADSATAAIPEFDGLFTCPPYWNLEKYDSLAGLDQKKTWPDFLIAYRHIMTRCFEAAKDHAIFCIMVGEWRKNHVYYDLEYQTCNIFSELGASVKDKIIISRKKISKIKIMLPQCKRLGYSVRVHETLLVFNK